MMESSADSSEEIKRECTEFEYTDYTYKAIVVGSSGAGKTSLIRRAVDNRFDDAYTITIAGDFSKLLFLAFHKRVKLQLWDTCGLEQYRSINKIYFKGASAALLLFDCTQKESFEACGEWLRDVRENCSPGTRVFLVAAKTDLPERRVLHEQMVQFARENELSGMLEVSAKTGAGVDSAVKSVLKELMREFVVAKPVVAAAKGKGTAKTEGVKKKLKPSSGKTLRQTKKRKAACDC